MARISRTLSSRALTGAEVVELLSGAVLGTVFDTLIDADTFKVKYLGILPASWYQGGTVLAVDKVLGFDERVLLIEKASHLGSLQDKEQKKQNLLGMRELNSRNVIDTSGILHGRILGLVFRKDGEITGIEVEKEVLEREIPIRRIVAVGERYVIVELAEAKEGEEGVSGETKKADAGRDEGSEFTGAKPLRVATPASDSTPKKPPRAEAPSDGRTSLSEVMPFSQVRGRKLENIIGKASPLTIMNERGETLVNMGDVLSPTVINKLLEEGLLGELFQALPDDR